MLFRDVPIKRKLTSVIMLTSSIVLLLTCLAFATYELITFRRAMTRNLATLAQVVAANCTGAVAFLDENEAREKLLSLKAERHIVAAAIYDRDGKLFSQFRINEPGQTFPARPGTDGPRFTRDSLIFFEPIIKGGQRLGTLYLESDLEALFALIRLYGGIVLLVLAGSFLVAFALSTALQKGISQPILELAGAAQAVSNRKDYSVRAKKWGQDELGQLTDSFNGMLALIHERDVSLRDSEERLRLALEASRTGTWNWDLKSNKMTWHRPYDEKAQAPFGPKPGVFGGAFEDFMELIDPQDRLTLTGAMKQALEQKTAFSSEFRVIWPDGSVHYLAGRGKGFYDEAGKPLRLTGVLQDISERKMAEEHAQELRRALEVSERQRAVERERARLARDMHDELGASLTRITMLSQSVQSDVQGQPEAAAEVDQIHSTAREITRAMDEIVWAVNPKYDTLDGLAAYLSRFAQQYLSGANIRCRLKMPVQLPPLALSAEVRHNVFLAFKEALNNVVKHARATEAFISLELRPTGFMLLLADNGRGFQWSPGGPRPAASGDGLRVASGNGLMNIQKRMEEIGGRCDWDTAPGAGTRTTFTVKTES